MASSANPQDAANGHDANATDDEDAIETDYGDSMEKLDRYLAHQESEKIGNLIQRFRFMHGSTEPLVEYLRKELRDFVNYATDLHYKATQEEDK